MTCENDLLSGPIWLLFEAPSRGGDGGGWGLVDGVIAVANPASGQGEDPLLSLGL